MQLSHNTALVITPPDHALEPIQTIRRQWDVKHVDIWPPHVTLFYPFLPPKMLPQAIKTLTSACSSVAAFPCRLAEFGHFDQGKKGIVTWLSPHPNNRINELHSHLGKYFPSCFKRLEQPHMTVARGQKQAPPLASAWKALDFEVLQLTLLERTTMGEPMRVVQHIKLACSSSTTSSTSASYSSAGLAPSSSVSSMNPITLPSLRLSGLCSCVIMPPGSQWPQFVDIKKRHMKPTIRRPPYPHMTMMAPFVSEPDYRKVAQALQQQFRSRNVMPFEVSIDSFDLFENAGSSTLYLKPTDNPPGALKKLQRAISAVLPHSDYKYEDHIGIGYFKNREEARRLKQQYQEAWKPIKFRVTEVYFLSRRGSDDPWNILQNVPLEGYRGPAQLRLGSQTSLASQMACL